MTQPLTDAILEFLSGGPHYATIATLDPDGGPRQAVIWYRLDGDTIVINSLVGRRWPSNLLRDPRISIAITDRDDGLRWVGVVGTAEPVTDQPTAQADIASMAQRYHADEPGEADRLIAVRFSKQQRISFRIRATSAHEHLDD
jgi:PPOX class probable F420-dependent enzyme